MKPGSLEKIRSLLMCGALLAALSCAPQGELQRTLHNPNKKYAEKRGESLEPAAPALRSEAPSEHTAVKGLPESCGRVSSNQLCIECQNEGWLLQRCYDYKGATDLQQDCVHTSDRVKCLAKSPPFALSLAWRAPEEKFLRENYLVWQEAVHTIWDPKLSQAEKHESETLLQSLDLTTRILTTTRGPTDQDAKSFAELMPGRGLDSAKQSKELLASLQKARQDGRLSLRFVLDRVGAYYEQTHGPSKLWAELRTMSLQGLDETN